MLFAYVTVRLYLGKIVKRLGIISLSRSFDCLSIGCLCCYSLEYLRIKPYVYLCVNTYFLKKLKNIFRYISPLLGFTDLDSDAYCYVVSQPSRFKIYIATVKVVYNFNLIIIVNAER